jgi:hypothetical protein
LIGSEAFLKDGVQQLDLSFKYKPTDLSEADWNSLSHWIQLFAKEFYRRFATAQPEIAKAARIYIGAPSSWSKKDIELYQALFPPPPLGVMSEVEIVPESRSAFIHVRDYHLVDRNREDSVLIIDIGSSTTDFTYLENLEPREIPIGSEFGARLIDQVIYEQVVNEHPDAVTLQKRLEDKDRESAYLQFLCRKAKEQYFTQEKKKPQPEDMAFQEVIELFWPSLQKLDMEAILTHPINEEYANGWKAGFRELLVQAKVEYKKKYGKQLAPKILLLTGGGSRMPFTREICREVFDLQAEDVSPDPQPFFSVSKGLAGYGRWRYRVATFRKAIDEFCQSKGLGEEIQKHIQPFEAAAYKFTSKRFMDKVLFPILLEAQAGKVRSKDMGNNPVQYFSQRFFQWLETPQGQAALQEEVGKCFTEPLSPYLATETNKICERFGMKEGDLRIAIELPDQITKKLVTFISPAFDQLLAYTAKLEIGLADALVPVWLRKLVPTKVVEAGMQAMVKIEDFESDLFNKNYNLKPNEREQFAVGIRAQIKKQLEERAAQVEMLLK